MKNCIIKNCSYYLQPYLTWWW